MNLVDSCGWLEYFANGANADFFAPPLQNFKDLIVPSICLFEVFKKILQYKSEDLALQAVALMHEGNIIELDSNLSIFAAKLSFELKLPLADSVVLATAQSCKAIIWTQDEHFKDIKGVNYIKKN